MIYVFDVFNERLFFVELVEKSKQDPSKHYPVCCLEEGHAPQQLLMDQLFGTRNFSDSSIMEDFSIEEDIPGSNDLDDLGYNSHMPDEDSPDEY